MSVTRAHLAPWRCLRVAVLSLLILGLAGSDAHGWSHYGHMVVAAVAYDEMQPAVRARADVLLRLNPKYRLWQDWIPSGTPKAERRKMLFMIAATWADQIKTDRDYRNDGSHNGYRPEGSPDASANRGYGDRLRHKYWHFIDVPFSRDGTALPPIPAPNVQERLAVFRSVLSSTKPNVRKAYDLVWLVHLVGDAHQPLHTAARVSATLPHGDEGGNAIAVECAGCPSRLHAFWDVVAGDAPTIAEALAPALAAARQLPRPAPGAAAELDEKAWIRESFALAQSHVYRDPIGPGEGPFALTEDYRSDAARLARERLALAGVRLGRLLNKELK